MAKKKKHASILDYIEEKKSKRIDPAQLTIVKEKSNADKLVEQMNAIEGNLAIPKKFKDSKILMDKPHIKMVMNPAIELNPEEKKGFLKKVYEFFFGWVLTRKSDNENILQFGMRQFLPPDSSGKPSWQLFIVLWALVIMSYVTAAEIQVALSWVMTYSEKGQVLTKKMHGFSEAFIYFIMIFGGVVSGLFYKREKDRKNADGTNSTDMAPGILTSIKDRVSNFISKK